MGRDVHVGIVLQLLVEVDDVQRVQQLALVLVQPLYLHVEDGVGVQHHALMLSWHSAAKASLLLLLDLLQPRQHRLVVGVVLQLLQLPAGAVR